MDYLSVKNWDEFQHYKDRNPPWIKLHRRLLTDYEFSCLQDASKLHLMLIWLLASQCDNRIPCDPDYLKRVLQLSQKPDLNELIDNGFLVLERNDSNALADCKQVAMPETEAETETDIRANAIAFDAFWSVWPKKVDRKKAETAWKRLPIGKQKKAIEDAPKRYAETEKKFIPHPTTYIHGERWEDDMPYGTKSSDLSDYGRGGI